MYVNRKTDKQQPARYTLEVWPEATAATKPACTVAYAYARDTKALDRIIDALFMERDRLYALESNHD